MKIQYCSDLHLEIRENVFFLKQNPLIPSAEILLLAGDIIPFNQIHKIDFFFDFISEHFKVVYWLPGNHEYYHSDLAKRSGILHEAIRANIFLVNNIAIDLEDLRLVFTTLWSSIRPSDYSRIKYGIFDFNNIRYNESMFTPDYFNEQHEYSIAFLKRETIGKHDKRVIVTHYVPTFMNYPTKFKCNPLNDAFVTELMPIVEHLNARYWIYGHHHQSIPPFIIGGTTLVTNQLGYVERNEHRAFDSSATLDIN